MLLKLLSTGVLILSVIVELVLLGSLVSDSGLSTMPLVWLILHALASVAAAASIAFIVRQWMPAAKQSMFIYCFALCFSIPLAGAVGALASLAYGIYQANSRHDENVYWQFTRNAELPFTAPLERKIAKLDSRGFVEQIEFSVNADEIYRKVLAAGSIQNGLSVGSLKAAVRHSDDRVRLTAYQTLDKKVTLLNKEIQSLEGSARSQDATDQSNTWLQIASNYWELLTLEKDEPIAREQLLKKASAAAINSIRILPTNRNAHFTLGRIALLQNKERMAAVAFDRAMALGMPVEKAMPYRAEAEFLARDFSKVKSSIAQIDDAYKTYPPLCHLAGYWS